MGAVPVFTLGLSWALLGVVPPPVGLAGIPIAVGGAVLALRGGPLADTSTHPRADRLGPPVAPAGLDAADGPAPAAGAATRIR
jgi:drug/metabolite transporter (DMT)-like permease